MGAHPETFLGVLPSIVENEEYDILLPYLVDWDSDLILRHSVAYLQVVDEGFHVPSGVLHAPGSALTIELQEDSDVFAMLQAVVGGTAISKELLWKDVRPEDRERMGERFILELIDWEENGDPYFYENHHLSPRLIEGSRTRSGEEYWIYYNTTKFSGKKLVVRPGCSYVTRDRGVYNLLIWSGSGGYGGADVQGGDPTRDELLVTYDRAVRGRRGPEHRTRGPARDQVLRPGHQPGPHDRAALTRRTPSADGDAGACVEDVHHFRADAECERLADLRTLMRPQPGCDLRARPREWRQTLLPNAHLG